MDVKQIYTLMNTVTTEILGGSAVVQEDLSNVVDLGTTILNQGQATIDNYVKTLIDHIGKVIFVNRPYSGSAPSVLMDGWEYGSILEKIQAELPSATENESWELVDGQSYDPNVFYKPSVSAKFFNSKTTFEIPMSFTSMQVKESFSSAGQLNAFLSMLYGSIDKSMTIKTDALIMRTINNMIAETIADAFPGGTYTGVTSNRAINLLYLYNTAYGLSLTAAAAVTDPDFIRFAAYQMGLVATRMGKISTLFNVGGKARFTPKDRLHIVMLSDFVSAADVFLQSDVFHDSYTRLPKSESVPYWQGSGTSYGFADVSKISVAASSGSQVEATGILGVMFDRDALGVANVDRRVTSYFNPKAEFYNNWYKSDASYFNDLDENFVVFYVA